VALLSFTMPVLLATALAWAGLKYSDRSLVTRQTPRAADVIIVLGGETAGRTAKALQLYRLGFAPEILVSGRGDGELIARNLVALGVPGACVLREDASGSTLENAAFSVPILAGRRMKTAIVVTSWFHSRRAAAVFRAAAESLVIVSVPTDTVYLHRLLSDREMIKQVLVEYLKIAGYRFRYGIASF